MTEQYVWGLITGAAITVALTIPGLLMLNKATRWTTAQRTARDIQMYRDFTWPAVTETHHIVRRALTEAGHIAAWHGTKQSLQHVLNGQTRRPGARRRAVD